MINHTKGEDLVYKVIVLGNKSDQYLIKKFILETRF